MTGKPSMTRAVVWGGVMAIAVLGAVFLPRIARHAGASASPWVYSDDVLQQIYPFFRYMDAAPFHGDYAGNYYLDCYPIGYRGLYTSAAWLGIDPAWLSKGLTYVLLLVTVVAIGIAAGAVGGMPAAWTAMALVLGSDLYLGRMSGGLPRAFGFPLIACTLAALAHGRIRLAAVMVPVSAAFYPVAAVIAGLSVALTLFVVPGRDRGEARGWSLKQRLAVLAMTAILAGIVLAPTVILSSRYGHALRPSQVSTYPEIGSGGRYLPEDRAPFPGFLSSASLPVERALFGGGRPFLPALRSRLLGRPGADSLTVGQRTMRWLLAGVVVLGTIVLLLRRAPARRMAVVLLAAVIGYTAAVGMVPYGYLPTRYVLYCVPLVATLMVSTCVAGFCGASRRYGR